MHFTKYGLPLYPKESDGRRQEGRNQQLEDFPHDSIYSFETCTMARSILNLLPFLP